MKILAIALVLVSFTALADSSNDSVNQACARQAISVANHLKQGMFNNMSSEQESAIIKISTDECRKQFNQSDIVTANTERSSTDKNGMDWFTDYVLNGDTPDKPGNKRLKKLQHK